VYTFFVNYLNLELQLLETSDIHGLGNPISRNTPRGKSAVDLPDLTVVSEPIPT